MFRKIVNGGSTYWINTDAINYIESDPSEPMIEVYFRSGETLVLEDINGTLADTIAGTVAIPKIDPRPEPAMTFEYYPPVSFQLTSTGETTRVPPPPPPARPERERGHKI